MGTLRAIIRASRCAVHLRVNNSSVCGVGAVRSPGLSHALGDLLNWTMWTLKKGSIPIHRSAQKGNSQKLNFRFTEFSEVGRCCA
jgi:hypothetical protein